MRFFQTISVAALASVAAAQSNNIKITKGPGPCSVGETCSFEFTSTASTPVKVVLRKGASGNLKDVEVLSESARPPTFSWTPKEALLPGTDYAVQVFLSPEDFNYSGQFAITGGTGVTSSASSSASATGSRTTSQTASGTTASTSATVSSSASGNSTTVSHTLSHSQTLSSSTRTAAASSSTGSSNPVPTGAAYKASSPMAFLFGAVAAVMYLN